MKKLICSLLISSFSTLSHAKTEIDWNQFFIGHAWLENTSGVLYFSQDLNKNSQKICDDLKKAPHRISMIDQESESIYRLSIKDAIPPSYNTKLSYNEFKEITDKTAKTLKKYCVKVNLAPVADGQKGNRIYSQNPDINQKYVNIFAQSMRENKIVPTYKHFPGLNQVKTVYDTQYKVYYKNIYGEGIVDSSNLEILKKSSAIFQSYYPDVLMFSIATYYNISNKPIIYNEDIWKLAYERQPNSLYIPDDLSELIITNEELVFLFKKFDLLMFTAPSDIQKSITILNQAYEKGLITQDEINHKKQKIAIWKSQNHLN